MPAWPSMLFGEAGESRRMITVREDEEWKKLKGKYGVKPQTKKPISKRKLSVLIVLPVLCLSILAIFLYFFYFALPVYSDVNAAVASIISSEVGDARYSLSGLPSGRCYWIRPMYNESGHFVEIIEYRAESVCIGVTTNKTVLHLASALNIVASDCICGNNSYTMEKTLDKYGINLKLVAK